MSDPAATPAKPTVKDFQKLQTDFAALQGQVTETVEKTKSLESRNKELEAALEKAQASDLAGDAHLSDEGDDALRPTNRKKAYGNSANSDESKALRYFGCGHVKDLVKVNTAHPRFRYVPSHLKMMVMALKDDVENARAVAQIFHGAPMDRSEGSGKGNEDAVVKIKNLCESRLAKEQLIPKLKAFGSTVVGGGDEWVPTLISETYIPEFELERELMGQLRMIDMPSSPFQLPTATGLTIARRATEGTTATDSQFTTGKIDLNAKKFLEYYILPEELNEDSIVPILEFARGELTQAHLRAIETALINGTQFGTAHIDSDTQAGAADLAQKQWHGFRKYAIANSANGVVVDFGNAFPTDALLRQMRTRMGALGVNPRDCIWIPGSASYNGMLGTDNVVTVEKYGPQATVLTGALTSYAGAPIVVSGFMREDLNATGVYDGVTTNRTGLLFVHKRRWYMGTRRAIRMAIRPARSADDRYEMASYSRFDFTGHAQSASEKGVVYGVNVKTV